MKVADRKTEIVSEAEWLVARKDLLTREKEFSRQRDALSAARRELPMVKVTSSFCNPLPSPGSTHSWVLIIFSIWCRKGVTRIRIQPCRGFAGTMSTGPD